MNPGEPDACGTWTAERLDGWLRSSAEREPVIVLAHGEPAMTADDRFNTAAAAWSGHASAVEPLIRACSGVWIAHDLRALSGEPERTPETPPFRVRRIALPTEAERGSYYAFANEALWPMCHRVHVKPTFRTDDFTAYWRVNAQFADAVVEEASGESPLVLVQDYHFALAPLLIRERLPLSRLVTFWHIPWPHWQAFEICPWGRHVLEGLLGSSILGFQTPLDCRNFIETVERLLGAHVDRHEEAITYAGRYVRVRSYPASVRWPGWWTSCSPEVEICRDGIRRQLGLPADVKLGVGIDRLDASRGIEEKFLSIERLLECYPEFRNNFVFAQLITSVREPLPGSCELASRVRALATRINRAFGRDGLQPIVLLEADHAPSHVNLFLRAADLCYVGSLHDGMSLVAKEFVAAREDEAGVLVLSTFAGAARELTDALVMNPYDTDAAASLLARALTMPADEQRTRMRRLRSVIAEFSAWRWAAHILSDAARLRRGR
jgi:trehalose 6-phosphate synthase